MRSHLRLAMRLGRPRLVETTLGRVNLLAKVQPVQEPRRSPVILSREEVAAFLRP